MGLLLKHKYFAKDDFLRTKDKCGSTYLWKSIFWGREVILKGSRWHVGNSETIRVFDYLWLPRPTTCGPLTRSNNMVTKVKDLMIGPGIWDDHRIDEVFILLDREVIKGILLSVVNYGDNLIWRYGSEGAYSIKSGYNILLNERIL